jgi:thymidine phosphorylase
MKALKVKRIALDTHTENVAFLSSDCKLYRPEAYKIMRKIEVRHAHGRLLTNLMVAYNGLYLGPEDLGLSEPAFSRLGLREGAQVTIAAASEPASLESMRRKITGEILSPDEIGSIIEDISAHRYSEIEIAAFLVSCASFMTTEEVLSLTKAMARMGNQLKWPDVIVADKHCVGGIPGNRTSMIVVPIVAAHGMVIPKTSSRAITSPSGTADTMEVLARVDLSIDEMQAVVSAHKGCLIWGGHVNLSPADDILISVERPLHIDTREQMIASILSKKLAAGSTHLVIDIPVGPSAKVRTMIDAMRVRKLIEHIATQIGLDVHIVTSDGSEPVGRGIGPVLEARDVMKVLECEPDAPADLKEKSIQLAGRILEYDPNIRGGTGYAVARNLLDTGAALRKFTAIMEAQGPPPAAAVLGKLTHDVCAPLDGIISGIDCYRLARIARLAGAPLDKGAGIDLYKRIGMRVEKGEPLYRICAVIRSSFDYAKAKAAEDAGFEIHIAKRMQR